MTEKQVYIVLPNEGNKKVLLHVHIPQENKGKAALFLNPILDEKKRVQSFQASTARVICNSGYFVFRFDYKGSGDSEGELYEFDLCQTVNDIHYLIRYLKKEYAIIDLTILGIRLGADLALIAADSNENISSALLIEPIVKGKRYIMEQRARRKSFYKLNNMSNVEEYVKINDCEYEDFQGFPMSKNNVKFIEDINSDSIVFDIPQIAIFRLNLIFSKKVINKLTDAMISQNVNIHVHDVKCLDFWSSLESIDTSNLTKAITAYIK